MVVQSKLDISSLATESSIKRVVGELTGLYLKNRLAQC